MSPQDIELVPVGLLTLLPESDGYWPNQANHALFRSWVDDLLEWAESSLLLERPELNPQLERPRTAPVRHENDDEVLPGWEAVEPAGRGCRYGWSG